MRLLIFGAKGMLGHKLVELMSPQLETYASFRSGPPPSSEAIFGNSTTIRGIDVTSAADIERAFRVARPEIVINAVGLVKQHLDGSNHELAVEINSLVPHRLARASHRHGSWFIQISSDCVFSGERGNYNEHDRPDPVDTYGLSKLLGEVEAPATTFRTSIIGPELETRHGLFEWLRSQRGLHVRGYRRAIFSGLTTRALGDVLLQAIAHRARFAGLWHIASAPISKFDLLTEMNGVLDLNVTVEPDDTVHCDRSLDSTAFWNALQATPPSWDRMLAELANEHKTRLRLLA